MGRFTTPYAQGVKIHLSSLCFSVDPLKTGLLGGLRFLGCELLEVYQNLINAKLTFISILKD